MVSLTGGIASQPCARCGSGTRSAARRPGSSRAGRRGSGIYACGPTVYSRIHVGNARPYVIPLLLGRFLAHEGYEPMVVINVTDVNDKIYDAAREAGVPSAEHAARMIDGLRRGHRPAGDRAARRRAAGDGDDRRDHRADRGADRRRARLRVRAATSTSGSAASTPTASSRTAIPTRWTRARRPGRRSSRRARSTSRSGRRARRARTTFWPSPWGDGPAGVAHRVLGDGREAARNRLRDPQRRLRPDLSPSRERDRADRGRPRRAAGADLDAQRDGPHRRREDVEVGRQHLPALRGDRPLRRARRWWRS